MIGPVVAPDPPNVCGACVNPTCTSPGAKLAARGLCWNCYQQQRRKLLPTKRVEPCIEGRRVHRYGPDDKCKRCGTRRVFFQ